jgi:hypothetical protein
MTPEQREEPLTPPDRAPEPLSAKSDPFARPEPRPGDSALAILLHDECCQDEGCEGWGRVGSFGKNAWLDTARTVLASLGRPLSEGRLQIAIANAHGYEFADEAEAEAKSVAAALRLDAARDSRPDGALLDGIRDEVREAVIEGDANDCTSPDCIADAVYEIVRVRLRDSRPVGEGLREAVDETDALPEDAPDPSAWVKRSLYAEGWADRGDAIRLVLAQPLLRAALAHSTDTGEAPNE